MGDRPKDRKFSCSRRFAPLKMKRGENERSIGYEHKRSSFDGLFPAFRDPL
jgi:hypothetical protein